MKKIILHLPIFLCLSLPHLNDTSMAVPLAVFRSGFGGKKTDFRFMLLLGLFNIHLDMRMGLGSKRSDLVQIFKTPSLNLTTSQVS